MDSRDLSVLPYKDSAIDRYANSAIKEVVGLFLPTMSLFVSRCVCFRHTSCPFSYFTRSSPTDKRLKSSFGRSGNRGRPITVASVPTMTVREWCALLRGVTRFTIRASTAYKRIRELNPSEQVENLPSLPLDESAVCRLALSLRLWTECAP